MPASTASNPEFECKISVHTNEADAALRNVNKFLERFEQAEVYDKSLASKLISTIQVAEGGLKACVELALEGDLRDRKFGPNPQWIEQNRDTINEKLRTLFAFRKRVRQVQDNFCYEIEDVRGFLLLKQFSVSSRWNEDLKEHETEVGYSASSSEGDSPPPSPRPRRYRGSSSARAAQSSYTSDSEDSEYDSPPPSSRPRHYRHSSSATAAQDSYASDSEEFSQSSEHDSPPPYRRRASSPLYQTFTRRTEYANGEVSEEEIQIELDADELPAGAREALDRMFGNWIGQFSQQSSQRPRSFRRPPQSRPVPSAPPPPSSPPPPYQRTASGDQASRSNWRTSHGSPGSSPNTRRKPSAPPPYEYSHSAAYGGDGRPSNGPRKMPSAPPRPPSGFAEGANTDWRPSPQGSSKSSFQVPPKAKMPPENLAKLSFEELVQRGRSYLEISRTSSNLEDKSKYKLHAIRCLCGAIRKSHDQSARHAWKHVVLRLFTSMGYDELIQAHYDIVTIAKQEDIYVGRIAKAALNCIIDNKSEHHFTPTQQGCACVHMARLCRLKVGSKDSRMVSYVCHLEQASSFGVDCREQFQLVVQCFPAKALHMIGDYLYQGAHGFKANHPRAAFWFQQAYRKSNDPHSSTWAGIAYKSAGNADEAITYFEIGQFKYPLADFYWLDMQQGQIKTMQLQDLQSPKSMELITTFLRVALHLQLNMYRHESGAWMANQANRMVYQLTREYLPCSQSVRCEYYSQMLSAIDQQCMTKLVPKQHGISMTPMNVSDNPSNIHNLMQDKLWACIVQDGVIPDGGAMIAASVILSRYAMLYMTPDGARAQSVSFPAVSDYDLFSIGNQISRCFSAQPQYYMYDPSVGARAGHPGAVR